MEGEGCVQEEREADQEEGAVVCEITTKDEITTKLKGEATGKIIASTRQTFVGKVMFLLFNMPILSWYKSP